MTTPREGPTHTDLAENLQWCALNGYVPAEDVTKRYEWERHGNADQWIDVRWNKEQIAAHHRLYVAMGQLARVSPETLEELMADVRDQQGGQ